VLLSVGLGKTEVALSRDDSATLYRILVITAAVDLSMWLRLAGFDLRLLGVIYRYKVKFFGRDAGVFER